MCQLKGQVALFWNCADVPVRLYVYLNEVYLVGGDCAGGISKSRARAARKIPVDIAGFVVCDCMKSAIGSHLFDSPIWCPFVLLFETDRLAPVV